MLLQEIKITGGKIEEILSKTKPRYECMAIDVRGSASGIEILWNQTEITVNY